MTDIRLQIDAMHNGSVAAIVKGVSSSVPLVVMNAILAGTEQDLHDTAFIDGVRRAGESSAILLNIPLRSVAAASLHLLGAEQYRGQDSMIWSMIHNRLSLSNARHAAIGSRKHTSPDARSAK